MIPNRDIRDFWSVGRDAVLEFRVSSGEDVEVAQSFLLAATSITVKPLLEAIANGAKVRFGNLVVTLSADAAVGATTLAVTATAGGAQSGTKGKKCENITGQAYEFVIRETAAGDVILSKSTVSGIVLSAPTEGVYQVTLARADTISGSSILIDPAEYYYTTGRTDAGFRIPVAEGIIDLTLKATR